MPAWRDPLARRCDRRPRDSRPAGPQSHPAPRRGSRYTASTATRRRRRGGQTSSRPRWASITTWPSPRAPCLPAPPRRSGRPFRVRRLRSTSRAWPRVVVSSVVDALSPSERANEIAPRMGQVSACVSCLALSDAVAPRKTKQCAKEGRRPNCRESVVRRSRLVPVSCHSSRRSLGSRCCHRGRESQPIHLSLSTALRQRHLQLPSAPKFQDSWSLIPARHRRRLNPEPPVRQAGLHFPDLHLARLGG